jgi:hypothetical protein
VLRNRFQTAPLTLSVTPPRLVVSRMRTPSVAATTELGILPYVQEGDGVAGKLHSHYYGSTYNGGTKRLIGSYGKRTHAERHRATAKELWGVREEYINLLADISSDATAVDIPTRRDELTAELAAICKFAPDTTSRAYRAAQKALKVSEDMTFSEDEINAFLPDSLHQ